MTSHPDRTGWLYSQGSDWLNGESLKLSGAAGVFILLIYVVVLAGRWDVAAALIALVGSSPVIIVSVNRGCRTTLVRARPIR
ncbi:hypothetical protein P3L51_07995 [Streptomyces sp. PSRA5]|uniref:hypothetical protein n=1 Tax=Streptomyces panacea TaxID=3035064 RepID=UPI00339CA269